MIMPPKLLLRDDPFFPSVAEDQKPIDPEVVVKDLQPHRDRRVLRYYFDIYEVKSSQPIGSFSKANGFSNFPSSNIDSPPVLIVNGTKQSGCDSLVNLLLYQIGRGANHREPFVIRSRFLDFDKIATIKTLRQSMLSQMAMGLHDLDASKVLEPYLKTDDSVGALAQSIQSVAAYFEKTLKGRPVVVRIASVDDYALWTAAYVALKGSVNFILIETTRPDLARSALSAIKSSGGRAIIFSLRIITRDLAHAYVKERITAERAGTAATPIFPFTLESIDYLFDEAAAQTSADAPQRTIGWLRDTLRYAFQEHLKEVDRDATSLEIDRGKMQRYRNVMNSGDFDWDPR